METNGQCKKVEGPRLVRLWFSTIRFCTRFTANESQYLCIEFKDGHTEHIRGPTSIYKDHLLHSKISVKDAVLVGKARGNCCIHKSESKGYTDTMTESIKCVQSFFSCCEPLKKFHHSSRGKLQDGKPSCKPTVKISLMEVNNVITRSFKIKDNYALQLNLSLTWKKFQIFHCF